MTLEVKSTLIAVTVVIIVAFALGRYSAPSPDIKIDDTKISDTQKHQDKDTHEVIEETKKPDGTTVTRTTIDTSTKTDSKTDTKETLKETITPKGGKINVSALVANNGFLSITPAYGVSVSKEVIGPITAGVFGLTNGTIGLSVGINF